MAIILTNKTNVSKILAAAAAAVCVRGAAACGVQELCVKPEKLPAHVPVLTVTPRWTCWHSQRGADVDASADAAPFEPQ